MFIQEKFCPQFLVDYDGKILTLFNYKKSRFGV